MLVFFKTSYSAVYERELAKRFSELEETHGAFEKQKAEGRVIFDNILNSHATDIVFFSDGVFEEQDFLAWKDYIEPFRDIKVRVEIIAQSEEMTIPFGFAWLPNVEIFVWTNGSKYKLFEESVTSLPVLKELENRYWISAFVQRFNQILINKLNVFLYSRKAFGWTARDYLQFRQTLFQGINDLRAKTINDCEVLPTEMEEAEVFEGDVFWNKKICEFNSCFKTIIDQKKIKWYWANRGFKSSAHNEFDFYKLESFDPTFVQTPNRLATKTDTWLHFFAFDSAEQQQVEMEKHRNYLRHITTAVLKSAPAIYLSQLYDFCYEPNCENSKWKLSLIIRSRATYSVQTPLERDMDYDYNNKTLWEMTAYYFNPNEILVALLLWFYNKGHTTEAKLLLLELERRFQKKIYLAGFGTFATIERALYNTYRKQEFTNKQSAAAFLQLKNVISITRSLESEEPVSYENFLIDLTCKIWNKINFYLERGKTAFEHFALAQKYWPIVVGKDSLGNPIFVYLDSPLDDHETEINIKKTFRPFSFTRPHVETEYFLKEIFSGKRLYSTSLIEMNIKKLKKGPETVYLTITVPIELLTKTWCATVNSKISWYNLSWNEIELKYPTGDFTNANDHLPVEAVNKQRLFKFGKNTFIPMHKVFKDLFGDNWLWKADGLTPENFLKFFGAVASNEGKKLIEENGNIKHVSADLKKLNRLKFVPPTYLFFAFRIFLQEMAIQVIPT